MDGYFVGYFRKEDIDLLSFTNKVVCIKENNKYKCTYLIPNDINKHMLFTKEFDNIIIGKDIAMICNNNICEIHNKIDKRIGFYCYDMKEKDKNYLLVSNTKII